MTIFCNNYYEKLWQSLNFEVFDSTGNTVQIDYGYTKRNLFILWPEVVFASRLV